MAKVDIFIVEDNEDFSFIMEKATYYIDRELKLESAANGMIALQTLKKYECDGTIPKIILLDLNLPGLSGLDLLKEIKTIDFLKQVPVILFTTSDNPKDVKDAIDRGADAYITKPNGYISLIACLKLLFNTWFTHHADIKY